MSDKQIILTQNDYGISLELNVLEDKNKIRDLNNIRVKCDIITPSNLVLKDIDIIVTDVVNGVCELIIISDYTKETGLYKMYVKTYDSNSFITGQSMLTYYVMPFDGGI